MSGDRLLVDTNILIYLLQGENEIVEMLQGKEVMISFITEIELLSFPNVTEKEQNVITELINDCQVVDLNEDIKIKAVEFRKLYKLTLPDALIAATCEYFNIPLLTADADFPKVKAIDLIKYEF